MMAAARQNEIKVSITVVATKTLITGRCRFPACVDIFVGAAPGRVRFAGTLQPEYISVLPLVLIGQCLTNFGEHFQLDASPRHSEGRPRRGTENSPRRHGGHGDHGENSMEPKLRASVSEPALSEAEGW